MSRRFAAFLWFGACVSAPIGVTMAWAQEAATPRIAGLAPVQFAAPAPPAPRPIAPADTRDSKPTNTRDGRSWILNTLYASTAVVHALDAHSTLSAFKHGAIESNPLLRWAGTQPDAFLAVKAAVATSTILAARALARHHRTMAIVLLAITNGAYAAIVRHNYSVLRQLK